MLPLSCMLQCGCRACSESSSVAVDVTSQEQMVPVILHFLQPCLFSPPILTTAGGLVVVDTWWSVLRNFTALLCSVSYSDIAMCLYTLTEDNPPSCRLLTSSPSHMEQLEALLSPVPAHERGHSHMLVVATAIAGIRKGEWRNSVHVYIVFRNYIAGVEVEVIL